MGVWLSDSFESWWRRESKGPNQVNGSIYEVGKARQTAAKGSITGQKQGESSESSAWRPWEMLGWGCCFSGFIWSHGFKCHREGCVSLKSLLGAVYMEPTGSDQRCSRWKAPFRTACSAHPWLWGNLDEEWCGRRAKDATIFSGEGSSLPNIENSSGSTKLGTLQSTSPPISFVPPLAPDAGG